MFDWSPDHGTPVRAVVHIAHGMAEHAARYARLAERLTAAGIAVSAADHRGHGQTAKELPARGIFSTENGWALATDDLRDMLQRAAERHPGVPLFLMGHSMGSLLSQQLLTDGGTAVERLAGAVLSGTNGKPPPIATVGRYVARFERWRLGPDGRSAIIDALTFQDFNNKFKPTRTDFDWLSRDTMVTSTWPTPTAATSAADSCGSTCSMRFPCSLLTKPRHESPRACPSTSSRATKTRWGRWARAFDRWPTTTGEQASKISRASCIPTPDTRH